MAISANLSSVPPLRGFYECKLLFFRVIRKSHNSPFRHVAHSAPTESKCSISHGNIADSSAELRGPIKGSTVWAITVRCKSLRAITF